MTVHKTITWNTIALLGNVVYTVHTTSEFFYSEIQPILQPASAERTIHLMLIVIALKLINTYLCLTFLTHASLVSMQY